MKPLILSFLFLLFLSKNTLSEEMPVTESLNARINMLEKALAPQTPEALAHLFAEANKNRNGAVQYMLFSEGLKKQYKDAWPFWVSGTSSPWITGYSVNKKMENNKKWTFQIHYQWATADGPFKPDLLQEIQVEAVPEKADTQQKFWISVFKDK